MNKFYVLDKETNVTYYLVGIKSASPSKSATLTEYPIPEGGYIADHSYRNANTVNFSLISDGYNVVKKSYAVDINGNVELINYDDLKTILDNWLDNGVKLDIQTNHDLFKNMILTSYEWVEDASSWSKFSPQLQFKEARIAESHIVPLKTLDVTYGADYSTETEIGSDNGTEVTSESATGTVLASATVGGTIGLGVGKLIGKFTGSSTLGGVIGTSAGALLGGIVGFFKSTYGG